MQASAFIVAGAYASAKFMIDLNLPFFTSFPLSGITAAAIGMLFGLPSLRVKGFYLALATIAALFIII